MKKFKKAMRYVVLGLLIILAICGIPIVSFLPRSREMDVDNEVKTEIVEGTENGMEDVDKT